MDKSNQYALAVLLTLSGIVILTAVSCLWTHPNYYTSSMGSRMETYMMFIHYNLTIIIGAALCIFGLWIYAKGD